MKSLRNKTIVINHEDVEQYKLRLIEVHKVVDKEEIINKTINQDFFTVIDFLPDSFVDLLFIDPCYNLTKVFNGNIFRKTSVEEYSAYVDSWLHKLVRVLKEDASIYICGDYFSSTSIHLIGSKYFNLINRITWQREKGRGASNNWKSSSEDIWFFSKSKNYNFYVDKVKEKKKVIAPYREKGIPKSWEETTCGNFRLTYPSNLWTDITCPFWSMPENTEHPTQKPEKLLAKIILASSKESDVIFDPFLGSGTTSVVAKKLNRNYVGIEQDVKYCCLTEKRLTMAEDTKSIQGYKDGVFWERNITPFQKKEN